MNNNNFHDNQSIRQKSSLKYNPFSAGQLSRYFPGRWAFGVLTVLLVLGLSATIVTICRADEAASNNKQASTDGTSKSSTAGDGATSADKTTPITADDVVTIMNQIQEATEKGMTLDDPEMVKLFDRLKKAEAKFAPVNREVPARPLPTPVSPSHRERPKHVISPPPPAGTENAKVSGSDSTESSPAAADAAGTIDSDDDIVQIKTKNDLLDVNLLIETVGKELHFTFLYDSEQGISGSVKLQKYGPIHRSDLLPLLESVLRFKGFTMIREDPFIRIVKMEEVQTKATPFLAIGETESEVEPGDSVVTQLIKPSYIDLEELKAFLSNFTDPKVMVTDAKANYLIITEYASRMSRLLDLVNLVDQPGPEVKLAPIEVKHIPAADAKSQIDDLITALAGEGMDETAAPTAAQPVPRRTRRPIRRTAASAQPQNTHKEGPELLVDERTNRLLVVGTESQIERVRQLLALLDVKGGTEIRLAIVQVQHVVVEDVTEQLADLIKALTEQQEIASTAAPAAVEKEQPQPPSRRSRTTRRTREQSNQGPTKTGVRGPILLNDGRTNRLFIIGTDDQITQAQELLAILDIPPYEYGQPVLKVYQPQYVEAEEVRRILEQLGIIETGRSMSPRERARYGGDTSRSRERTRETTRTPTTSTGETFGLAGMEEPEIRVAVQESTNKIFILALEQQHKDIAEIMSHVDLELDESLGAIRVYPLENRKPEDVASMLSDLLESDQVDVEKKVKIPGKEGAPIIVPLEDIYAIAVRGSKKQHEDIASIIKVLDKRLPQVLVEAILVKVSESDNFNLGVHMQETYSLRDSKRGISLTSPVTTSGPIMAFFNDDFVYASLEALKKEGNGKVVSQPRILVNDNETGSIVSQDEKPTTKTTIPQGSDTPITEFNGYVNAGTTLEITPHISEGDFLQLEIKLEVNSFAGEGTDNIPPGKTTNSINTLVTVPNGKTIVLGGLTSANDSQSVDKIPWLGDVPLLGTLFRGISQDDSGSVLYVFVRANIVRSEGPNGTSDFSDLDDLSETYRERLRRTERDQERLPVIPGIKNQIKDQKSVLDQ